MLENLFQAFASDHIDAVFAGFVVFPTIRKNRKILGSYFLWSEDVKMKLKTYKFFFRVKRQYTLTLY